MMGVIAALLLYISSVNAQDKWGDYLSSSWSSAYFLTEESGEIVIRGKEYTILNFTMHDLQNEDLFQCATFGFKRETEDSVLVIRAFENPDSSEYLLYVYNVPIGDTIRLEYIGGGDFVVDAIDTVALLGESRRRVHLREAFGGGEDVWIDGIGSIIHGYLWRGGDESLSGGYKFSCYYNWEQDLIWSPANSHDCLMELLDTSACETLTSSAVPIEYTTVTLYPNPFSWEAHVVGIPVPYKLTVYDISGKVVIQSIVDNDETTINTAHLADGMYYIVLIPERGNPITIKAIKI